jgi:ketosteroid isomerase-like protein
MTRTGILALLLSISVLPTLRVVSEMDGVPVTVADVQTPVALTDASFKTFLAEFERGTSGFVNGDATLWKQHASHRDDVTLMGGWGTTERGWREAGARYDWAVARFAPSGATVSFDYLASGVSGDLAYTVTIERSTVRITGQPAPASMALRVTQLFRRENGAWKMMHRHADPLMSTTSAESVITK